MSSFGENCRLHVDVLHLAIFVRDGIHSVADYDSTWMGVSVIVVVVVV